jgi:hypothetical protein
MKIENTNALVGKAQKSQNLTDKSIPVSPQKMKT